jgi:hypothetical protein
MDNACGKEWFYGFAISHPQEHPMFELPRTGYEFECPPDSNWLASSFVLFSTAETNQHNPTKNEIANQLEMLEIETHCRRLNLDWDENPKKPR